MRSLFALALAALLALTSVAFGAARGQARVAGEMVLCLGGAVVTVSVDERGTPVRHAHHCPDCAALALAALLPAEPRLALPAPASGAAARAALRPPLTVSLSPSARGPPSAALGPLNLFRSQEIL